MNQLGQYIISVTAAAAICGIVSGLVKGTAAKEGIGLLCGLFLAVSVLGPLTGLDVTRLVSYVDPYFQSGEDAVLEGEEIASSAISDIIKAETEAYILDKASGLQADLSVEVSLSEDPIPVPTGAVISGQVSPYSRQRLETILQKDLGIPKENQVWTG